MKSKAKKIMILAVASVVCAGTCLARPHGGPGRGFGGGHHHHHHSGWGRGGRNFWPGFVGGIVGGALYDAVVTPAPVVAPAPVVVNPTPVVVNPAPVVVNPAPVVVSQPAVVTPPPVVVAPQPTTVWVEGLYVEQVQANGTVMRVWQPWPYEQR